MPAQALGLLGSHFGWLRRWVIGIVIGFQIGELSRLTKSKELPSRLLVTEAEGVG